MDHKEGFFNGIGSLELYHQCWLPEDKPEAVLLIVHGLGEHCGRYENVVNHFVPKGYVVYAFDHPGHGRSQGPRLFVNSFNDFINNLKLFFDKVRQWQSGKKIFLVGHSMGGLITAAYLLKYQHELAGAVISAPAVKVSDNLSKIAIFAAKIISKILPKAGIQQLDAQGISSDPEVVKAYINDPLVYNKKVTARLGAELITAMEIIADNVEKIILPVIILQGGADTLVDPGGARMLQEKAGSKDKTLHIYDGFFHEVFNEPDHSKVLNDVAIWLDRHVLE